MCGIFGTINKEFDIDVLNLIKHRGPDSFGITEIDQDPHFLQLGHRRLSIVDLSEAGNQPMISSCSNFTIIFNGEIYNHNRLREKLTEIDFKGHSDTETILYYLAKFGIEAVADLNGIFGLAFYDKTSRKLYLSRDPIGVKPVYYYSNQDYFMFSSEIRPISKLMSTSELSRENLATLLRLRYIPSPDTLHPSVKKLLPGEILEVDLSKKELKYLKKSILKPLPKTIKIDRKDALSIYKEKIEDAVERQLMSDVPLGILLSGGIDSAIVAKIAREKLGHKIKAFTIGFDDNDSADEIKEAEITAKHLDLEHHFERISFDKFLEIMEECCRIVEEPLATTSFIPMYYLSKLASEHVKVVLTGQGADEPLGGYKRYQGEYIRNLIPLLVLKPALHFLSSYKKKNEQIIRAKNALGIRDELERFENIYSIFSNKEIIDLIGKKDKKSIEYLRRMHIQLNNGQKNSSVERMMGMDVRLNLADDLLIYTDKITMHFALECRVPMLDHELLTFIESLPLKYRLGLNRYKIIHKDFASEFLPESIVNRPKKGFLSPTKAWFNIHIDKIADILLSKDSYLESCFDSKFIEDVLQMHRSGFNKEKQIFLLLSMFYWLKTNHSIHIKH